MDHRVPGRRAAEGRAGLRRDRCSSACEQGIVALYQKCPHLGCRVPECVTSQWFECPCHGSQYNQVGEKKGGPAPRGMDRFPRHDRRQRRRHRRHRHDRHRARRSAPTPPARRPRARTASGGGETLMTSQSLLASTTTTIACHRPRRHHRRLDRLRHLQRRRRAQGARLGDRAGRQPQAVLRRRGARGPAPRARPAARRAAARRHRHRPAAVLGARAEPPGRRRGGLRTTGSSAGARELFAPTADGGFNCAGCHGGMNATGGAAPFTLTDPATGEVRGGQLEGAGAEHRALPVRRGRGPLHPHLRPAGLADVGVGPRRRRPDERPADRDADRLPQDDPDPARGLRRRGGGRPATARRGHLPAEIQAEIEHAARAGRRGRRRTRRYGEALFNLDLASGAYSCARCHTHGLELRRAQACRARARFGWNLTGGSTRRPLPERATT